MIQRSPKRASTAVPNELINDNRLSLKARGLAAYVLAKPDDWRIDAAALARQFKEGRRSILAGLSELEDIGYLRRWRAQTADGKWSSGSTLYESLKDAEEDSIEVSGATEVRFRDAGSPDAGQPTAGEPAFGDRTLFPLVENKELREPLYPQRNAGDQTSARRGMRGTGTSPRELRVAADRDLAQQHAEAELDRLVKALPEKYAHLSEDIVVEKIEKAFATDEVRRLAALDHLHEIRLKDRLLRGGGVMTSTTHDQRRPA
jgi:hypothetical protein